MVFIKGASVFFSLLSIVAGKYTCPSGYAGQTGTPLCAGATGDTCSAGKCCKLTGKLCSSENTVGGNAKCKTGSDKHYFFDLKKNAGVAASSSDDNFRATCCTTCSQATCADWAPAKLLVACPNGKVKSSKTVLPSSDCSFPDDAKYKDTCCVTTPTTCSATGVVTGNKQCKAADPKNVFFDLKKGAVKVASGDFKSSCCTDCAAATCADWATVKLLVGCPNGKVKSSKTVLPSPDCSTPTDAKYKETCCQTPMKCADYAAEASAALPKAVASLVVLVGVHSLFI